MLLKILYFIFFFITCSTFFNICEKVLDKPRFNIKYLPYFVSLLNAFAFTYFGFNSLPMYVYASVFIILSIELILLFQNSFLGSLLYPLMASIYLMCIESIVIASYAFIFQINMLDLIKNYDLLHRLIVFAWFICSMACLSIRVFIPLQFLRIINQNREQTLFKFCYLLLAATYMTLNSFIYANVQNFSFTYLLIHQIITPLIWIGVISLTSSLLMRLDFLYGYKVRTLALEETISSQQNELLISKKRAERDSLVEVYNKTSCREKISEALDEEVAGAFFILDIDNFKNINDTKGHPFGDKVLIYLTKRLASTFREHDIIGRVGGDEFIIYLKSDSTIELIENKARELCQDINVPFSDENGDIVSVTISIGIALSPVHGTDFDTLYKNADTALYQSKSKGKNTFSIYGVL